MPACSPLGRRPRYNSPHLWCPPGKASLRSEQSCSCVPSSFLLLRMSGCRSSSLSRLTRRHPVADWLQVTGVITGVSPRCLQVPDLGPWHRRRWPPAGCCRQGQRCGGRAARTARYRGTCRGLEGLSGLTAGLRWRRLSPPALVRSERRSRPDCGCSQRN